MTEAPGPGAADAGLELLETLGRPVLDSQPKLAALIRSQLPDADAAFLALPERDGTGRIAGWRAASGRPLRAAVSLAPAARAALEARAAAATGRIEALAQKLEPQGDAGRVAAHSLRCALVTPTGIDSLQADGELPVRIFWGMARPGQARPQLDLGPPKPAATPAVPVAGASAASGATAATAGVEALDPVPPPLATPPGAGRSWPLVAWALPAALLGLLAWLILLTLTPLPPIVVDVVQAAPPAADPTEAPSTRVAELQAALQGAEAAEARFASACQPLPPPEPPPVQRVEAPPPEPPPPEPPPPEPKIAALPSVKPPPAEPPRPARPPRPAPTVAPPPEAAAPPTREACTPKWPPGRSPRVIFVLDGSGSMEDSIPGAGSRMAAAKQSIGTVVQNLHKDIRAGLVSFSDCGATARSPFYAASQRPTLLGEVNAVSPQRSTSLAASITRAGAAAPSRSPSIMVVVSDGGDTCGGDPCAAARAAKAAKPDLTINVIDLSDGSDGGVLQCVARAAGGKVFTPRNANQMSTQLQQATGQPDASGCP
jgi:outer membrane biosynthesis protein TonB